MNKLRQNNNYLLQSIFIQIVLLSKQIYYQLASQMNETLLKLEDINSFIKTFAYWIQIRLEEIEIWHNKPATEILKPESSYENGDDIANKFYNYKTEQKIQIKLMKKFSERIVQIFQFFKTKSKNQNLLAIIQKKLINKLQVLTNQIPLNVGQVIILAQQLMKKGSMLKNSFQRVLTGSRLSSRQRNIKSMRRARTDKLIKVQTMSICHQHPSYSVMHVQSIQSAENINKTGTNFHRNFSRSQMNRPKSVISISKRGQNSSLHKRSNSNNRDQGKLKQIEIQKLYAGMSLDKNYISKSIQRSCFMMKDCLKRNSRVIQKLNQGDKNKRTKTQTGQDYQLQYHRNVLGQFNLKTSKMNASTSIAMKCHANRKRKFNVQTINYLKLNKKQLQAKQNIPAQQHLN